MLNFSHIFLKATCFASFLVLLSPGSSNPLKDTTDLNRGEYCETVMVLYDVCASMRSPYPFKVIVYFAISSSSSSCSVEGVTCCFSETVGWLGHVLPSDKDSARGVDVDVCRCSRGLLGRPVPLPLRRYASKALLSLLPPVRTCDSFQFE